MAGMRRRCTLIFTRRPSGEPMSSLRSYSSRCLLLLLLLVVQLKVLPAILILVLNFLMADRFYKVVQKRRTLRARLFMRVKLSHP